MRFMPGHTTTLLTTAISACLFLTGATLPKNTQESETNHQDHKDHAKHQEQMKNEPAELSMADQIAELRAKMARLQSALDMNHQGKSKAADPATGMRSMQGGSMSSDAKGGMGSGMNMGSMQDASSSSSAPEGMDMGMGMAKGAKMANMAKGSMGGMKPGGKMQDMMMKKKGDMGMGSMSPMGMGSMGKMGMGAMPTMAMQVSALPGFPGASHIYHIGASGFFLDHADHVVLTTEQLAQINQAREAALLNQATMQRKIDQAEQELWVFTGSDAPDAAKIDAKVREIEKLRGDQRIAFIRAIGDAAKLLSEDQRKQLSGMLPPGPSTSTAAPMNGMSGKGIKS